VIELECAVAKDLLPDKVAGRVDPALAGRLDLHLQGCGDCVADLAVIGLLQTHLAPSPEGMAARIQAALRQDAPTREARPAMRHVPLRRGSLLRIPKAAWALASAAIIVLALGTSTLLQRSADPSEEEAWTAFFDGVRSVWVGGDGVVAGAPVLSDLSDLSDEALLALMSELGG